CFKWARDTEFLSDDRCRVIRDCGFVPTIVLYGVNSIALARGVGGIQAQPGMCDRGGHSFNIELEESIHNRHGVNPQDRSAAIVRVRVGLTYKGICDSAKLGPNRCGVCRWGSGPAEPEQGSE